MSDNTNPTFRGILQIGLVVKNAEETARRCWENLGIGPWTFHTLDATNTVEMHVHGQPQPHAMIIGHASIGGLDWEIIQPLDTESIYAEHLDQHGEGLHHILFDVDNYAHTKAKCEQGGHSVIAEGKWHGHPYAYLDMRGNLGCIVEIWDPESGEPIPAPDKRYPPLSGDGSARSISQTKQGH